jgi:hypothetical protein
MAEYNVNDEYEILTPSGFQDFDGIKVSDKSRYLKISFADNSELICSEDHLVKNDFTFLTAKELTAAQVIGNTHIINIETIEEKIELYDPINVGTDHEYIGNGLVHHNCEFLGSAGALISSVALKNMTYMDAIQELMDHKFKMYEKPQPMTPYVLVADTSQGKELDYSAFIVFDVSKAPYKIVATYKNNNISAQEYPSIIKATALHYNKAYVLGENNDVGSMMLNILVDDLEYENVFYTEDKDKSQNITLQSTKIPGIRTTKKTKRQGCNALKTIVEAHQLEIIDFDIISELTTFIMKTNGTYAADEGANDDLAMCCVLFAWLTTQNIFKDLVNTDLRKKLYDQKEKELEQDLPPQPTRIVATPGPKKFVHNGCVWEEVKRDEDNADSRWSGYPDYSS